MALKTRGEDVTMRIAVDGELLGGTGVKSTDFTATPRTELKEDDYLGEQETDLDIQHNGWDLGFSLDTVDAIAMLLTDEIIAREAAHTAHPDITITVIYTFREPGVRGKIAVFHGVFLKQDEEGFSGRKNNIKNKFTGKCKRRELLNA